MNNKNENDRFERGERILVLNYVKKGAIDFRGGTVIWDIPDRRCVYVKVDGVDHSHFGQSGQKYSYLNVITKNDARPLSNEEFEALSEDEKQETLYFLWDRAPHLGVR